MGVKKWMVSVVPIATRSVPLVVVGTIAVTVEPVVPVATKALMVVR